MFEPDYPIRTSRLSLRPFTPGDVDALYEYHRLPEVVRYLETEPRSRADVQAIVAERAAVRALTDEGQAFCLVAELADSGKVAGDCVLFGVAGCSSGARSATSSTPPTTARAWPPRSRARCCGSASRGWACTASWPAVTRATSRRRGSWSGSACAARHTWFTTSFSRANGPTS